MAFLTFKSWLGVDVKILAVCFGAMFTGVSVRLCFRTAHFQRALLHFGGVFVFLFVRIFCSFLLIFVVFGLFSLKTQCILRFGGFSVITAIFERGQRKGFFVYTFAAGDWALIGFLVCEHKTTILKSFRVPTALWVKSVSRTPIFVVFCLERHFKCAAAFGALPETTSFLCGFGPSPSVRHIIPKPKGKKWRRRRMRTRRGWSRRRRKKKRKTMKKTKTKKSKNK